MRKEKMKRKGVEQTRERRKRIREEKMGNEKLEKNILGGGGGGGDQQYVGEQRER